MLTPPSQSLSIPFDGARLPGYLRIARPDAPLVILIGGLLYAKEVELHKLAETFLARGLSVVCFDGPGQGELLQSLPMRLDFERVITAVLDELARQAITLNTACVGLFGLSLGGYLAARAAAMDPRIGACVSLSGFFNKDALQALHPMSKDVVAKMFGLESLASLTTATDPVSLANLPRAIACPLFIVHGANDHLVMLDQVRHLQAWATGKTRVWVVEQAEHLCFNCFNEILPVIGDWMAEQLHA
jgi:alpha-beta hydrolase superfamily lysophospholipase